jgi:hypothetical protein
MGYNNFDIDYDTNEASVYNSGDYEVISFNKSKKSIIIGNEEIEFNGYNVELLNLLNNENSDTNKIFIVDNNEDNSKILKFVNEISALNIKGAELMKAGIKNVAVEYFKKARLLESKLAFMKSLKDNNGKEKVKKTLDYGYAHTIHKSQGGTYNRVLLLNDTIKSPFSKEVQGQLRYVGVTRASEFVYIATNKEIKQLVQEQKQTEPTNTFKTANTAEGTQITLQLDETNNAVDVVEDVPAEVKDPVINKHNERTVRESKPVTFEEINQSDFDMRSDVRFPQPFNKNISDGTQTGMSRKNNDVTKQIRKGTIIRMFDNKTTEKGQQEMFVVVNSDPVPMSKVTFDEWSRAVVSMNVEEYNRYKEEGYIFFTFETLQSRRINEQGQYRYFRNNSLVKVISKANIDKKKKDCGLG